jgi:TatD DNase family protein
MAYSYIDIHTHLHLPECDTKEEEIIKRAHTASVSLINVGTNYATSKKAVECAKKYKKGVWATVGIDPNETVSFFRKKQKKEEVAEENIFDENLYKKIAEEESVVAIGECGLDYFYPLTKKEKNLQYEIFEKQIFLANEIKKPLMLHLRSGAEGNAYTDAYALLKKTSKVRGNCHFFAGSLKDAFSFWEMDYSTSFTGVITFASEYDEVIFNAPKHLIHAETDAPFVAPFPYRSKRNEPSYLPLIVKRQIEIRKTEEEEWKKQLKENAENLFSVKV